MTAQARTTHECPGKDCTRQVRPSVLTCPPCWKTVPAELRRWLWAAWDHGHGAGTPAHAAAITAIVTHLRGDP